VIPVWIVVVSLQRSNNLSHEVRFCKIDEDGLVLDMTFFSPISTLPLHSGTIIIIIFNM